MLHEKDGLKSCGFPAQVLLKHSIFQQSCAPLPTKCSPVFVLDNALCFADVHNGPLKCPKSDMGVAVFSDIVDMMKIAEIKYPLTNRLAASLVKHSLIPTQALSPPTDIENSPKTKGGKAYLHVL